MSVKLTYYAKNRERVLARSRLKYQESLEYIAQWRLEHREELREKAKARRDADPEKSREAHRRYYARNREFLLKKQRENYISVRKSATIPPVTVADVESQIDAISGRLLNEKLTAQQFNELVSRRNALEIKIIQLKNPVHLQRLENSTYKFVTK